MNVDGHKSESENATTGVPQGSVLGSLVSLLNVHEGCGMLSVLRGCCQCNKCYCVCVCPLEDSSMFSQ